MFVKVKPPRVAPRTWHSHASVSSGRIGRRHTRVSRSHPALRIVAPPDNVPRVLLGMPHGGTCTLQSARTFYLSQQSRCRVVAHADAASSAGLHNYNSLVCEALNRRDRGEVTHFAMIHADVQSLDSTWLDTLVAEMERTGCDVISAVVPIKAQTADPPTSTAVGLRSDPWRLVRYIMVSDYDRLPITFGPADVCQTDDEVLLINIGMWLADVRRPFWDNFSGFQFLTTIRRDPSGHRSGVMASDDWLWSRWLDAMGADYRATFAVPLLHSGTACWINRTPTTARAAAS